MHHNLEESDRAHLKIALHFIYLHEWEYQALGSCHTLHCKEPFMQTLKPIITEFETVIDVNPVVDQRRRVDNRILAAKKGHNALSSRFLQIGTTRVNNAINDMLMVGNDKAEHTLNPEVEVVNIVPFLVHVGVLRRKARSQL